MSRRKRLIPTEDMKEILLNMFKIQYGTEEEALEAYNNHLNESKDALKVYSHVYLEESEFSKEDFMMLPKPILNLISWMVQELDEKYDTMADIETWREDRPF